MVIKGGTAGSRGRFLLRKTSCKHICLPGQGCLHLERQFFLKAYSHACLNEASKLGSKGNITVLEESRLFHFMGFLCAFVSMYKDI